MRFRYLAEHIYQRPWFITSEAHASIRVVFERALASGLTPPSTRADLAITDLFPQRPALAIDRDGLAEISVLGPVGKGLSKLEQSCGATSFEQIEADFAAARAGGARGILLNVNSPGGTVTGTPECAELVAQTARELPLAAYTDDTMASAAYYLAAGANRIFASRSASVGSIGVYIPWMDHSAQYAAAGLRPAPIVNTGGDLKALGFGGTLSEEQRAFLQAQVDADFAQFKEHVLAHRAVAPEAMRGQCLSGRAALAANLVDDLGGKPAARAWLLARAA